MRTPKFWMLSFMLLALLFSCKKDTDDNGINDNNNQPEEKYKPWTQNEIDLIMSGEAHEPMRILLVDDLEDSLFLRTPTIDIKPDATDPRLTSFGRAYVGNHERVWRGWYCWSTSGNWS
ncbi:MAG: hypothetical protein ACOXZK_07225 [Bacteroidales bacterium]